MLPKCALRYLLAVAALPAAASAPAGVTWRGEAAMMVKVCIVIAEMSYEINTRVINVIKHRKNNGVAGASCMRAEIIKMRQLLTIINRSYETQLSLVDMVEIRITTI